MNLIFNSLIFRIALAICRLVALCAAFACGFFLPSSVACWLLPKLGQIILGLIVTQRNTYVPLFCLTYNITNLFSSANASSPDRAPIVVINHVSDYDTFVVACILTVCFLVRPRTSDADPVSSQARPVISTVTTTVPIIGTLIKYGYRAFEPIWVPPKSNSSGALVLISLAVVCMRTYRFSSMYMNY